VKGTVHIVLNSEREQRLT